MAGKVHTDYMAHEAGLHPALPPGKFSRAYAEGYSCQVRGGAESDNPHAADDDVGSFYTCWWRGFRDAGAGFPATHVGGPDGELVAARSHKARPADDKKDKRK